jgi:hypothetical protein
VFVLRNGSCMRAAREVEEQMLSSDSIFDLEMPMSAYMRSCRPYVRVEARERLRVVMKTSNCQVLSQARRMAIEG